eukprot:SAG11_NODE_4870_length_1739_cov_2.784146_4_plen_71_part_00
MDAKNIEDTETGSAAPGPSTHTPAAATPPAQAPAVAMPPVHAREEPTGMGGSPGAGREDHERGRGGGGER